MHCTARPRRMPPVSTPLPLLKPARRFGGVPLETGCVFNPFLFFSRSFCQCVCVASVSVCVSCWPAATKAFVVAVLTSPLDSPVPFLTWPRPPFLPLHVPQHPYIRITCVCVCVCMCVCVCVCSPPFVMCR